MSPIPRWVPAVFVVAALAGLLCLVVSASSATGPAPSTAPDAAPLADYGDAPDDDTFQYPTLYTTTNARVAGRRGPYHPDVSLEWLGRLTNTATLEYDANVVNLDIDDGNPFIFVVLTSLPAPAWFWIDVSIAPTATNMTRYLNVLIDHDNDNRWALSTINGAWPEWVMQNVEVNVQPGETRRIQSKMFAFSPDLLLFPVWVRATLTTQPINPATFTDGLGWDGSGPDSGLASGETEDWRITFGGPGATAPGGGIFPPPAPPSTTKRVTFRNLTPRVILPEQGAVRWAGVQFMNFGAHTATVTTTLGNCVGNPIILAPTLWITTITPGPPGPGNPGNPVTLWSAAMWPLGPPDYRRAVCRWNWEYDPESIVVVGYDEVEFIEPQLIEVGVYTESLPLEVTEMEDMSFPVYAWHTLEYPPPIGLLLTATDLPPGAVFTPVEGLEWAEGLLEWTPGWCDAGFHQATFVGLESYGEYTFTTAYTAPIYVINQNRPPSELITEPASGVVVTAGQSVTIGLAASDPDVEACLTHPEDRLFLSADVHSTAATTPTVVDNGDGTGHVVWEPGMEDVGLHTFVFTATDLYGASVTATLPAEVVAAGGSRVYLPLVLKNQ